MSNSKSPKGKRLKSVEANPQIQVLREINGGVERTFIPGKDDSMKIVSNNLIHHSWSPLQVLREVFLPEGFPDSVSKDYVPYQIFDSVQALASSFSGTLATKAILKGVGVGDNSATAAGATLQWIWKDGSGMIGRILYSWYMGSNLDSNAKTWRFMADILNDIALTLEISIPLFPQHFLPIVCTSSILKSIVGAAGGATRAALTQHQARRDNMADVSSKDGSQETLLVLLGMMLAVVINPLIGDDQYLTWIFFAFFTIVHLFCNYMAVSSVAIDKLNRQRADIVISHYLTNGSTEVLSPEETSLRERILYFETDNSIEVGCSIDTALKKSNSSITQLISELSKPKNRYLLLPSKVKANTSIYILLRNDCSPRDILKSYFEARLCQAGYFPKSVRIEFDHFENLLRAAGWIVDTNLIGSSQKRVKVFN